MTCYRKLWYKWNDHEDQTRACEKKAAGFPTTTAKSRRREIQVGRCKAIAGICSQARPGADAGACRHDWQDG